MGVPMGTCAGRKCDVGDCCFVIEVDWVEVDIACEVRGWFGAGGVWLVAVFDQD